MISLNRSRWTEQHIACQQPTPSVIIPLRYFDVFWYFSIYNSVSRHTHTHTLIKMADHDSREVFLFALLTWVWTPVTLLNGWLTEAAEVVVTGLTKGPLFLLAASYALVRVQQISMMWKHDFTLQAKGWNEEFKLCRKVKMKNCL